METSKKFHIEKNTVQETLIIPLFARKICSERFPQLFKDEEAIRICGMLDYDFAAKAKKMNSSVGLFGALEVAQRQYDLAWEVRDYLTEHPNASVVNLGCGLDDTFRKCDNGSSHGFNIDMPDVIKVRNELLPEGEREENLACDLNDFSWMDKITESNDVKNGAVFFASGVFYYFKTEEVKKLVCEMAEKFPDSILVFDSCNQRVAKLMTKTWLKEAGIKDVSAFFSLEDEAELCSWSSSFTTISSRSYMRGYRDIYKEVSFFHKLMIKFCEKSVRMRIVKITF
jgi:O-methyltransferase involved in polyketide biosynthesis